MEYLTKHQLILVALLVSFVTSIATGIVTVALMQQAPQGVTQTVNHVVQETVQEVVPTNTGAIGAANTSQTAGLSGGSSGSSSGQAGSGLSVSAINDTLVGLVAKNSNSLVRIEGTATANPPVFLGVGTLVSRDGIIVADDQIATAGMDYVGMASNGSTTPIDLIARNQTSGLAYFQIATTSPSIMGLFSPADLGNSDDLKVGQSIFALGGQTTDAIARGVITSLIPIGGHILDQKGDTASANVGVSGDTNSGAPASYSGGLLSQIDTDAAFDELAVPLIDLEGQIVGFETVNDASSPSEFLPTNVVKMELKSIAQSEASSTAAQAGQAQTGQNI